MADTEEQDLGLETKIPSASLYAPLSTDLHEIRMLNISPDHDRRVKGTLEVVRLTEPGDYIALSYQWGDARDTKAIQLTSNDVDYVPFAATSNLYKALVQLYRLG